MTLWKYNLILRKWFNIAEIENTLRRNIFAIMVLMGFRRIGQRVYAVSNGVPAKCLIDTHDININLYQAHWTYVSRSAKIWVGPLCTENPHRRTRSVHGCQCHVPSDDSSHDISNIHYDTRIFALHWERSIEKLKVKQVKGLKFLWYKKALVTWHPH